MTDRDEATARRRHRVHPAAERPLGAVPARADIHGVGVGGAGPGDAVRGCPGRRSAKNVGGRLPVVVDPSDDDVAAGDGCDPGEMSVGGRRPDLGTSPGLPVRRPPGRGPDDARGRIGSGADGNHPVVPGGDVEGRTVEADIEARLIGHAGPGTLCRGVPDGGLAGGRFGVGRLADRTRDRDEPGCGRRDRQHAAARGAALELACVVHGGNVTVGAARGGLT